MQREEECGRGANRKHQDGVIKLLDLGAERAIGAIVHMGDASSVGLAAVAAVAVVAVW
jgi:hypothetical protein